MSDLIERLHDVAAASRNHDGETDALIDAADTIERLTLRLKQCGIQYDKYDVHIEKLEAKLERLRDVLESIAANTCCEPCQEAKLVAKAALKETE